MSTVMEQRAETEARLSFSYLGDLRAELDGHALELGPRLQRHVLAILLVEGGRVVAVDRLIDLIWGDSPPAAAMASLQAYVSQLRRVIEPDRPPRAPARVLVTQDPGYVLRVGTDEVDGTRFLQLAAEGRELLERDQFEAAAERLETALGLWRGQALVEFDSEPWAVATAARLNEARDAALEDRVDAWLAMGRHVQAAQELEQLVEDRPLRERRWGQLILATYRSGRQADALRAYQRGRAVLADELGLEPGAELRRLEAAVLAQDPSLDLAVARRTARPVSESPPPPAGPRAPLEMQRVQLDRIATRIADTAAGSGGVVVLVGEPGVGKTTLAEKAAAMAQTAGQATIWSRCIDASAAPAYWPWVQLLRRLPEKPKVALARSLLEGQAADAPEAGNVAKFRAYEATVEALAEAAAESGLVCLIDDLHAADDPSLDLLLLVAGDLAHLPVLFVATLRDTEPSSALDRTLGELLLQRGSERLAVSPLTPGEVASLAEAHLRRRPEPAVAEALFERTGGNVFYLVELIRLLGSEHPDRDLTPADVTRLDVPSGVRDVIVRRVARLPDNTRTLLTLAAVTGGNADLDLLEEAARLDSEQLMLGLEPAVAAGLLTTGDSGWVYRFRHPLIQESIYSSIPRVERSRLHARVAAALEAMPDTGTSGRSAQLAHHYLSAGPLGDLDKAVAFCRQAARSAMQVGAWSEAVRLYSEALTAAGTGAGSAPTRCDVLVELGGALRAQGRIGESHQALEQSLSLAEGIGDEDRVLAAAVAFGAVSLWGSRAWGEQDSRLVALLERQLNRLEGTDDARTVRLLATLAGERWFGDDAPVGLAYARRGLELARRLGDPSTLGIALSGYLLSTFTSLALAERTTVIEEFLARPDLGLGPDVEAVLRINLLTERLRFGELARFDAELGRCWELVVDVLHSPELEAQLILAEAARAVVTGDADGARQLGERGWGQMVAMWSQPSGFVMESALPLISGSLPDLAEDFLQRALRPEHVSIPHLAAPAAALGFALRGDDERAAEVARQWFSPPPRSWTWLQAIAYWAQVSALVGEPDPLWLEEQLRPHAGQLAVVGIGVDVGGAVDSLLAGLVLRAGRKDEALRLAQAGMALERRAGSRHWLGRTSRLIDAARA